MPNLGGNILGIAFCLGLWEFCLCARKRTGLTFGSNPIPGEGRIKGHCAALRSGTSPGAALSPADAFAGQLSLAPS